MKKRADGRYQLSIMIGYNENGTPKRKVVYGKTQKELKDKASELRMQYNQGLKLDNNVTIGEWAEIWLKTYKSGVEYKTLVMYTGIIKNYVSKYFSSMKLCDLKTAHLQKVVNDNSHKRHTMRQFKLTITQMMEQAILNDLVVKIQLKA